MPGHQHVRHCLNQDPISLASLSLSPSPSQPRNDYITCLQQGLSMSIERNPYSKCFSVSVSLDPPNCPGLLSHPSFILKKLWFGIWTDAMRKETAFLGKYVAFADQRWMRWSSAALAFPSFPPFSPLIVLFLAETALKIERRDGVSDWDRDGRTDGGREGDRVLLACLVPVLAGCRLDAWADSSWSS